VVDLGFFNKGAPSKDRGAVGEGVECGAGVWIWCLKMAHSDTL